jgi:hypothetical protein
MFFGFLNIAVGILLDIKFLDIPLLIYFVFFDLFIHLMQFFSRGQYVFDDEEDEIIDENDIEVPYPRSMTKTELVDLMNKLAKEDKEEEDDDND